MPRPLLILGNPSALEKILLPGFDIPEGIKILVEKQTTLKISGTDKQQVGAVVSKLKTFRKIEPYKGKGVREKGQYVLKKEGKKK